ncbi:hypothetical protein CLV35_3078 [Motilibacter peucedani]|uniref:Fibronectin type-III domain-containing protein n=1 Tax=Motilibacter peucedani TaxID=598650 RepID=A0A420XLC1_9ACTN|nr:hypothetical protein [Motilibacter peucedani]RKS71282.1 hypothetical protein CLV35_3078 [Motilibacter peucedani]
MLSSHTSRSAALAALVLGAVLPALPAQAAGADAADGSLLWTSTSTSAAAPSSRRMVASALDGTGAAVVATTSPTGSPSADGTSAISLDQDGELQQLVRRAVPGGEVRDRLVLPSGLWSLQDVSSDGSQALLSRSTGVAFWRADLTSGTVVEVATGDIRAPRSASFDPSDPSSVILSSTLPGGIPGYAATAVSGGTTGRHWWILNNRQPDVVTVGSPDGLAVVAVLSGAGQRLLFARQGAMDDGVEVPLARPVLGRPVWSHDDRWVYWSDGDIWRVHSDGTGLQQLTSTPDELEESPVIVASPPPAVPPVSAPTTVSAGPGADQVVLRWTPSLGTLRTRIYRADPATGNRGDFLAETASSAFIDSGLVAGTTYGYLVVGVTSAGVESMPAFVRVSPTATPSLALTGWLGTRGAALQLRGATPGARHVVVWTEDGSVVGTTPLVPGADQAPVPATHRGVPLTATVTPYDPWGNAADAVRLSVEVPLDDRDARFSGTWRRSADPRALYGGTMRSAQAGASATLRASGRRLSVLAATGPRTGAIAVLLDGRRVAQVDTRTRVAREQRAVWTSGRLRPGRHVLRVVVLGTRGRATVRLDGVAARH